MVNKVIIGDKDTVYSRNFQTFYHFFDIAGRILYRRPTDVPLVTGVNRANHTD